VLTFGAYSSNAIASLGVILILALVHLFVKELRRLGATTRNALLSAGAGASLAYVLLRILPKLAEKQEDLLASADTGLRGFLEHHAYIVAMVGLVAYYGLSRVAAFGADAENASADRANDRGALIGTTVGHAAYSVLIGYLIVNRLHFGLFSLLLITLGMGTLFLVSDHGLFKKWPDAYESGIRWVLSIALLAGWAMGVLIEVSPNVVALWYAFLAGVMLMITIGEKLAIQQVGSFWPFLAGVVVFTALLLILERMPQVEL
jgi:hypothetical protein